MIDFSRRLIELFNDWVYPLEKDLGEGDFVLLGCPDEGGPGSVVLGFVPAWSDLLDLEFYTSPHFLLPGQRLADLVRQLNYLVHNLAGLPRLNQCFAMAKDSEDGQEKRW